jgi:hypothetical protein
MALKPGTARDSDDSLYLGWLGNLPSLPDLQQQAGFTLHEAAYLLLISPAKSPIAGEPTTTRRVRTSRRHSPCEPAKFPGRADKPGREIKGAIAHRVN